MMFAPKPPPIPALPPDWEPPTGEPPEHIRNFIENWEQRTRFTMTPFGGMIAFNAKDHERNQRIAVWVTGIAGAMFIAAIAAAGVLYLTILLHVAH